MVYDIIRDNDSMGDVCSQVYLRFSCPGCVRGRYSDTLISSILFLTVRLIVMSRLVFLKVRYIPSADRPWGLFSLSKISVFFYTFFQQSSIALSYLECSLITLLSLFNLISQILWN